MYAVAKGWCTKIKALAAFRSTSIAANTTQIEQAAATFSADQAAVSDLYNRVTADFQALIRRFGVVAIAGDLMRGNLGAIYRIASFILTSLSNYLADPTLITPAMMTPDAVAARAAATWAATKGPEAMQVALYNPPVVSVTGALGALGGLSGQALGVGLQMYKGFIAINITLAAGRRLIGTLNYFINSGIRGTLSDILTAISTGRELSREQLTEEAVVYATKLLLSLACEVFLEMLICFKIFIMK